MQCSIKWFVGAALICSPVFAQQVFDVNMDGAQVPTASGFTGSGTVTLNGAETQITVTLTHNVPNANVTDGHIHQGAAGVNGGIIFPFSGMGDNPINEIINLSPAQVTTLKAGNYYVNIHTMAFPAGEIRGQILPRQDTDGDLLADVVETNTGTFVSSADTGTDPNDPDTDGDGVGDGIEVSLGTDPNSPGSVPPVPINTSYLIFASVGLLLGAGAFVLYRRRFRANQAR